MNGVKKYSVSILNDAYTLVSDESELLVMAAASRIDTLMREISKKGVDPKRAAVLAALKVSIDLLKIQEDHLEMESAVSSLINSLHDITI